MNHFYNSSDKLEVLESYTNFISSAVVSNGFDFEDIISLQSSLPLHLFFCESLASSFGRNGTSFLSRALTRTRAIILWILCNFLLIIAPSSGSTDLSVYHHVLLPLVLELTLSLR